MIVRRGAPGDVSKIVAGTLEFARTAYPGDKCDANHIATVIGDALTLEGGVVAVMETPERKFAGAFVGIVGPNPLTGKPVCAEVILWVDPSSRGHGRKLIAYVEEWAKAQGCAGLALSRPEAFDRVGRLFEAWGYVPTERWYRKGLA